MESEFEEQSRLDFIKRIKSENIVRVYNEEWTVRPNRGIEIDFNRATNYLSRCHTQSSNVLVELETFGGGSRVGNELVGVLANKVPILSVGMGIINTLSKSQQKNTNIVKVSSNKCRLRKTSTEMVKIYELDLIKVIKPSEEMLNFFPKLFDNQYTDESVQIFVQEYGYFIPTWLTFGARETTTYKLDLEQNQMDGKMPVELVAYCKKQQNKSQMTDRQVQGCKSKEQLKFLDKQFDPRVIVLLEARRFISTVDLLPLEQRIKIRSVPFYKQKLEKPSIMTINQTIPNSTIGWTGPIGDPSGQEVVAVEEGYHLTSITGFWDIVEATKQLALYPLYLTKHLINKRQIPPKSNWQRLVRIHVVLSDEKGNRKEYSVGNASAVKPAGSFVIDFRKDVVQSVRLGLDHYLGGVGLISVKKKGSDFEDIGREDLCLKETVKTMAIGGRLLGLRARGDSFISQMEFVYSASTGEMDLEISRFLMN